MSAPALSSDAMNDVPARYRVDDKSILLAFYQRLLWDWLTPRIPLRVTPNTLTVVGQILGVVSALACAFAVRGHRFFYIVSALSMIASLTLDNIDGAHARRTGQCSRRGELLDHGLDGITSTSVLIATGLMLRMSDSFLCAFGALGTLTFAATFWEQFRTGLLSLPKIGPTEGVTAVALSEVLMAALGEPGWLRFSSEGLTAGTVVVAVVVLVHAVAVVPPFFRAAKQGVSGWEIAPLFVLVASQCGFVVRGASSLIVVVTMGLMCAHTTCHLIVLRHRGRRGPVVPRTVYLAALPLVVITWAPGAPLASAGALVAMGLVTLGYAHTVRRGWTLLGPGSGAP